MRKRGEDTMYQAYDYNLYKNNLREAENLRKREELIDAGRSTNDGLLLRLVRTISSRNQPRQAANYAQHAGAH